MILVNIIVPFITYILSANFTMLAKAQEVTQEGMNPLFT